MGKQLPEESSSSDSKMIIMLVTVQIILHGFILSPLIVYAVVGFEPAVIAGFVAILSL